ncbi:MAG TPA: hypothetical protein VFE58_13950 [Tepidisphaeraceae bacterium]|jgi:hypothetical protein|nr:hypothetical protein [Tepidisphaeraceae bacterium]
MRRLALSLLAILGLGALAAPTQAVFDKRFDICTMYGTPDGGDPHFSSTNLTHLNFATTNGHMLTMPTDSQRVTINGAGNFYGAYYNSLSSLYGTYNGSQAADQIENYIVANCTANGVKPTWVIVNEISGGSWPSDSAYRAWLRTCIGRLHTTYGHTIILCAPFTNPLNNASDWVPLSANCYIGIEGYLTGTQVNGSGNSVTWCQTQYQSFKTSYLNLGIAASQIYLVEHYANTVSGTAWGRSGVSYAGWDNAIRTRISGMKAVGFAGYVGFGWEHNGMGVSEADQCHFEDTYASQALP